MASPESRVIGMIGEAVRSCSLEPTSSKGICVSLSATKTVRFRLPGDCTMTEPRDTRCANGAASLVAELVVALGGLVRKGLMQPVTRRETPSHVRERAEESGIMAAASSFSFAKATPACQTGTSLIGAQLANSW